MLHITYITVASCLLVLRRRFGNSTRGATAVEYAIMLGAIAGAVIVVVTTIGEHVEPLFQRVLDGWPGSAALPPAAPDGAG
jgi:Flp pilus assembly pilin Flp